MPYLNVDDGMDEHEKIEALSDAAFRLHMTAMLFCSRKTTDGYLALSRARRLTPTGTDAVAAELVRAGVWHDISVGCLNAESVEARTCHAHGRPGHYMLHDYLQWNHSKAWWEKRRTEEAERLRKYRSRRKGSAADAS